MTYRYSQSTKLINFSRENRQLQTDTEKRLWSFLRNRQLSGFKFRRQYPIDKYILDFYCVERKLAIELDGSHHLQTMRADDKREERLKKYGITIIRFWDNEVFENTNGVLGRILESLT